MQFRETLQQRFHKPQKCQSSISPKKTESGALKRLVYTHVRSKQLRKSGNSLSSSFKRILFILKKFSQSSWAHEASIVRNKLVICKKYGKRKTDGCRCWGEGAGPGCELSTLCCSFSLTQLVERRQGDIHRCYFFSVLSFPLRHGASRVA